MSNTTLNAATSDAATPDASAGALTTAEAPRIGPKEVAARRDAKAQSFDYGAAAELFAVRGRGVGRRAVGYWRFTRAAEAIQFAVEQLSPAQFAGAYLEVDEIRFDSNEIRRLYDRGGLASASRRRRAATVGPRQP